MPHETPQQGVGSPVSSSKPRRVALGISGGIAAYKSAELARALIEHGITVEVVMTSAAQKFITPLTLAALTGRKVITDLFGTHSAEDTLSSAIEHIRVAQDNDVLVVAPATADVLAKLAHGLADDFLTTTYLAFTGPVVLAPAMNSNMWSHPAVQQNLQTLRARGHIIVEPGDGMLACGMVGPGRLAEPDLIVDAVARAFSANIPVSPSQASVPAVPHQDMTGETFLITAGPTQEPLDAVRYLTNRSSGKMGYSLAQAALDRGARVILVSGPVTIDPPQGAELIRVQTAMEMRDAVMDHLEPATVVIKSAAVADYHRADAPKEKMKKTATRLSLELDPTPDILAEVGRNKGDRLLIGFAAETGNLIEEARRKLQTKNCDMVVANLVSKPDSGFDADHNEVVLVPRTGPTVPIERALKIDVAHRILDALPGLRLASYKLAAPPVAASSQEDAVVPVSDPAQTS